jgi:large subunit ribosomal protein L35
MDTTWVFMCNRAVRAGRPGAGPDRYTQALLMPKMKSHSGAKKRFKKTGTGKLQSRPAFSSHILEKKSPKKKRALGLEKTVAKSDRKTVTRLLGGNSR